MSRKRLEGFVVGRKTVRQTQGWKIAVRSSAGKRNYFAPEANFAEGMEVVPGQEVEFSTQKVEGRWCAFEITPLTAQMEERTMREVQRFFIAVAALSIILVFLAATNFQPTHWQPFRDWVVVKKANHMLAKVKQLTADQIISDDMVRAAIRNNRFYMGSMRDASWAAREEIFSRYMEPIFNIGYDDPAKTCEAVRYVDQMDMDPDGYDRRYYNDVHVTTKVAPVAKDIRSTIYETCRSYLMTPENLQIIYKAKKEVAINTFLYLRRDRQFDFINLVSRTLSSFIRYRDDDSLRTQYQKYLELETAYDKISPFKNEAHDLFTKLHNLEVKLTAQGIDWQSFSFAGRRYAEGGEQLLSAYISILNDFQQSLMTQTK